MYKTGTSILLYVALGLAYCSQTIIFVFDKFYVIIRGIYMYTIHFTCTCTFTQCVCVCVHVHVASGPYQTNTPKAICGLILKIALTQVLANILKEECADIYLHSLGSPQESWEYIHSHI